MPLSKGKSQKTFVKNLKTEIHAGKPMKQSLAIAYAMKRKGERKKMSEGGDPGDTTPKAPKPAPSPMPIDQSKADAAQKSMRSAFNFADGGVAQHCPHCGNYADGGMVGAKASGYETHEGNDVQHNSSAMSEAGKDLNQHMPMVSDSNEDGMVDRIMMKRSKNFSGLDRYSKGGQVANQEHGENNNEMAGFSPNEFDDLVLRDDLESDYGDDDNAGDALGNAQEDEDRSDIVSKIMKSRAKKDKLPRPA